MSGIMYRLRVAWRVLCGRPVGYRLVFRSVGFSDCRDTLFVQCKFGQEEDHD